MANFNRIDIIGNVGKEPEMTVTSDGTPITKFSVAVNDTQGKNADGSKRIKTTWFNVVCWSGLAEIAERYLHKGMSVFVSGKLEINQYKDKNGIDRTNIQIIASIVQMLGKKEEMEHASDTDITLHSTLLPEIPDNDIL